MEGGTHQIRLSHVQLLFILGSSSSYGTQTIHVKYFVYKIFVESMRLRALCQSNVFSVPHAISSVSTSKTIYEREVGDVRNEMEAREHFKQFSGAQVNHAS